MNTVEFLQRVLPATGLYVIARMVGKHWRHQVCDSIPEAAAYALQFDSQGVPTYHAVAAYSERSVDGVKEGKPIKQVRVHKNVRALRSFFMDLDCGEGKEFESQAAALDALVDFCNATSLPIPMVVSSGGGIHLYWTLNAEILPETWRQTAGALKRLAAHHNFKADPACTADPARVLRSVGTWNRKQEGNPRAVELVADAADVSFAGFAAAVDVALKQAGVEKPADSVAKRETKEEKLNADFAVSKDFPPCSGKKVADRCAQLAKMRNTRGAIPEPLWYASIGLLAHAVEGDELIHAWSDGYDGYSREETQRKIIQIRGQGLGPTLCATFEDRSPGGCNGCPFKGKISSPVQLGTVVASAAAPTIKADDGTEVALPQPPNPFTRGANGGIYMEEDGITHRIYEHDCFPIEIVYDERQGYETMRIRHHLPKEGWQEFACQSSLLAKPVEFEVTLRDNSIQPLIRNRMTMYFDSYLRSMRADQRMRRLFRSMGWKNDNTEFVLGDKLYRHDSVVTTGASKASNEFLGYFKTKGDAAKWTELTPIFNQSALAPHAFFLLLAFASPLLRLAGEHGFTVCALGETGAGKSTMAKMLASVYGHPEKTWCSFLATDKSRYERLGMYNAIPAYTDEVSPMNAEDVGPLLYLVATGKGRDSLTRNREVREGLDWATILACSTNQSLLTKLTVDSANPVAESMRLFEFWFPKVVQFAAPSRHIPMVIEENYGGVGAKYIENLVRSRATIVPELWQAKLDTEAEFGMATEERFWTHAVAYTLYGGMLARKWGLIDFDPNVIRPWLHEETKRMREDVQEGAQSYITLLSQYLNETVGERLVITGLNKGLAASFTVPQREISQRWEKDQNLLFVTRSQLLEWMRKWGVNHKQLAKDLRSRGILLDHNARKVLGVGTSIGGGPVPCWVLKTNHPELTLEQSVGTSA